jgi:hypothetical protein
MIAPGLLDRYIAKAGWNGQVTSIPNPHGPDNLYEPVAGHQAARGRFGAKAKPKALILDPAKLRFAIGATTAVAAAVFALRRAGGRRRGRHARAAHGC